MPVTKLILLIVRIFVYSALVNAGILFVTVYVNTALVNIFLPADTHATPSLTGATMYAIYTGLQLSLFFTTFALLVIRLSILSGTILTIREIVRYYKKFIFATVVVTAVLVCSLCIYFTNFSQNRLDLSKAMMSGYIVSFALPCFWLALTLLYYRGYHLKTNEPDGSKDRSWLEGNIENRI